VNILRNTTLVAALALASVAAAIPTHRANATIGSTCALNDISLTILGGSALTPTACVTNTPQGSGPTTELSDMVALFQTQDGLNLSTLNHLLASSDGTSNTQLGIKFTVAAAGTTSGTWSMGWTDTNGSAPANLPLEVDLLVGIYGGNNGDGYLFRDVILPAPPNNSGTGTFNITFLNKGGQIPSISHMILGGGNFDPVVSTPEPATLTVLGAGLAALGLTRRRRSR
jgi:PEP-CTERM motif